MEGEDWCRRQCDKCRKVLPEGWDYAMCRECGEEPCKHGNQVVLFYSKENERLRQLVEECNECFIESDLKFDANREK